MALAIHVNGEAKIKTGTGAANALEDLGVSVDGVDIEIRDHTEPVFTDTYGPDVPFDEQQFLMDALIKLQLVFYDDVVLGKIRSRPAIVLGNAEGTTGHAGALWGGAVAPQYYFRVLVLSPTDALPYNFPVCRILDSASQKIGTRRTLWDLTFLALPYSDVVGDTATHVLYNRVTT